MNTATISLRTLALLLAGMVLSTAAFAEDTAATSTGLETLSLRTPVLNDDGSTTLPSGTVLAAPGHITVNEDGSITLANGKTIAAPTLEVDDTVAEPVELPVSKARPTVSSLLAIENN
jgi:hypothetical protein